MNITVYIIFSLRRPGGSFGKTAPWTPAKLFIHGQPVLHGFHHFATFSPKNPLLRGVAAKRSGCVISVSSLPHFLTSPSVRKQTVH
jgi:hypothetical protein